MSVRVRFGIGVGVKVSAFTLLVALVLPIL
jgi:hypothetical protein